MPILPLYLKARFYATVAVVYKMASFYAWYFGVYLPKDWHNYDSLKEIFYTSEVSSVKDCLYKKLNHKDNTSSLVQAL